MLFYTTPPKSAVKIREIHIPQQAGPGTARDPLQPLTLSRRQSILTFQLPPGRAKLGPDCTGFTEMKGNQVRIDRKSSATPVALCDQTKRPIYTAFPVILSLGDRPLPIRAATGSKPRVPIHVETLLTPGLIYSPIPGTKLFSITLPFGHSIVLKLDRIASWQRCAVSSPC